MVKPLAQLVGCHAEAPVGEPSRQVSIEHLLDDGIVGGVEEGVGDEVAEALVAGDGAVHLAVDDPGPVRLALLARVVALAVDEVPNNSLFIGIEMSKVSRERGSGRAQRSPRR